MRTVARIVRMTTVMVLRLVRSQVSMDLSVRADLSGPMMPTARSGVRTLREAVAMKTAVAAIREAGVRPEPPR